MAQNFSQNNSKMIHCSTKTLALVLALCSALCDASCHFNACGSDTDCIKPLACKLFHDLDGPAIGCCSPPARSPSLRGLAHAVRQMLVTPVGTGLMHNTDDRAEARPDARADIVTKAYTRAGAGEADEAAEEVVRMALHEEALAASERRLRSAQTTRELHNDHEAVRPNAADIAGHLARFVAPPAASLGYGSARSRDDF